MTRTETKGERKRMRTRKQNTSNSSYLEEEVTRQIIFLGTKPLLIFTDALFQVDVYSGLIGFSFVQKTRIFILNWN